MPGVSAKRKPPPLASIPPNENETSNCFTISTPAGEVSKHFIGTPSAEGILSAFLNFDDGEGPPLDADFDLLNSKCQQADPGEESFASVSTHVPNSSVESIDFSLDKLSPSSSLKEEYDDDFEEDSDGDSDTHGTPTNQETPARFVDQEPDQMITVTGAKRKVPPQLTEALVYDSVEINDNDKESALEEERGSSDLSESIRFGIEVAGAKDVPWNVFEQFALPVHASTEQPIISHEKFAALAAYYGGCSPAAQSQEMLVKSLFDKMAVVTADGRQGVTFYAFCAELFPGIHQEHLAPPADKMPEAALEEKLETQELSESIRCGIEAIEDSATPWNVFVKFAGPPPGSREQPAISQEKFAALAAYYGGYSPVLKRGEWIQTVSKSLFHKLAVACDDGGTGITFDIFCAELFPAPDIDIEDMPP